MRGLWSKTTFEVFYNVISVTFTHLHNQSKAQDSALHISIFFQFILQLFVCYYFNVYADFEAHWCRHV